MALLCLNSLLPALGAGRGSGANAPWTFTEVMSPGVDMGSLGFAVHSFVPLNVSINVEPISPHVH